MKKLLFTAILVVFFAVGLPVFAQTQTQTQTQSSKQKDERDSEYYYVNVTLEKIYPYHKGYVVQYRKGLFQHTRAYLPAKWFIDADAKGEIITLPAGLAWPSMTVYYKNGEFSHVRLYVHRLASHATWGNIPQSVNIDSSFENVDSVAIEF